MAARGMTTSGAASKACSGEPVPASRMRPTGTLESFGPAVNAAVVGASGGLGRAFVNGLAGCPNVDRITTFSRSDPGFVDPKIAWTHMDLEDERTITRAAGEAAEITEVYHIAIVATGILHDGAELQPEKSWRALDGAALEKALRVNTIGPALVAKHFLPRLARDRKAVFAALSARVGSIADNDLGGWYAYRASKAALNMLIKTLSIELARRNSCALCVALHPGTVDTALSKPFQRAVPDGKLFSPGVAANNLLGVLDQATAEDTGCLLAWDGTTIPF